MSHVDGRLTVCFQVFVFVFVSVFELNLNLGGESKTFTVK